MDDQAVQLQMKLFSYVVARDYGFAPNPFYGWCTLATCKPRIRAAASVGDWVIGTGAKSNYGLAGHLIFAMRVDEICDFDAYWRDPRFSAKKPVLNGSLKQLYGDNIYHREGGRWKQEDSHHSREGGQINCHNVKRDTSANRVLISQRFVYFGENAPAIPKCFRPYRPTGEEICCLGQGHRVLSERLAQAFESWLEQLGEWGLQGMPLEFKNHKRAEGSAEQRRTAHRESGTRKRRAEE
jgi:hypothetical protein